MKLFRGDHSGNPRTREVDEKTMEVSTTKVISSMCLIGIEERGTIVIYRAAA